MLSPALPAGLTLTSALPRRMTTRKRVASTGRACYRSSVCISDASRYCGSAVWSEAVTHAAENIGTTELHEVQTELKESAKKSEPAKGLEKPPN